MFLVVVEVAVFVAVVDDVPVELVVVVCVVQVVLKYSCCAPVGIGSSQRRLAQHRFWFRVVAIEQQPESQPSTYWSLVVW